MAARPAVRGRATGLTGRRSECGVLDRLVDAVRAGESRALVVAGEPGTGKTALLDYVAGRAGGFRVARGGGPGGDGAGVPRVAAVVRADAGWPGGAAGSAAGWAADRARVQRRAAAGPGPGRPGG